MSLMDIDSYKIATFDRIHTGVCCGTCRHSKSNTGMNCLMNSKQECLGNNWTFLYKHWEPVVDLDTLPDNLFEV